MLQINATLFLIAVGLALAWGFAWAHVLDTSAWWKWAVIKRTWLTVVVGVGVNCAILFVVLPWQYAVTVVLIFAVSSVGILRRSFNIERREDI
jgi:CHASE2 domain-containing sensor protein